jgi:hypothetical protein
MMELLARWKCLKLLQPLCHLIEKSRRCPAGKPFRKIVGDSGGLQVAMRPHVCGALPQKGVPIWCDNHRGCLSMLCKTRKSPAIRRMAQGLLMCGQHL